MEWILEHFKLVALIAVVGISLAKRYLDARRDSADEKPGSPFEGWAPPPPPPPRRQASVPPPLGRTAVPPPLAAPPPQRGPQRSPLPPPPLSASMTEAASAMQRQQEMMERLRQAKEAKETRAKNAGSSHRSPVRSGKSAQAPVAAGLRGILRTRSEIRRAVILREVLGPPLGMR